MRRFLSISLYVFLPLQTFCFSLHFLYRSTQSGNRIQLSSPLGHFPYCFVDICAHYKWVVDFEWIVDFERIVDLALICLSCPLTYFFLGTQGKARHLFIDMFLCEPGWVKDRIGLDWIELGGRDKKRREPSHFSLC